MVTIRGGSSSQSRLICRECRRLLCGFPKSVSLSYYSFFGTGREEHLMFGELLIFFETFFPVKLHPSPASI